VVGVLSDRDISPRRRNPSVPVGKTVEDVMSAPVATIDSHQTIRRAANVMEGRTIGCLPVTDNGKLVGIITTSDLLRLLGKGGERPAPNGRVPLSHKVPHKKGRVGSGRW
jgi:acetoin utilization protein AcuB